MYHRPFRFMTFDDFNRDRFTFILCSPFLFYYYYLKTCTAIRNLDHCAKQDCDIITIYLKGVSDGSTVTFWTFV